MICGCFSNFWCSRRLPSPSDDAVTLPAVASGGVSEPCSDSPSGNRGVYDATAIESARPRSPPSPDNTALAPSSLCPAYHLDPTEAQKHIGRISRFRVLVMGRANAGKTTILQRVCDSTDQPEIFNGEGQKVDGTVVQGSLMRGHHNIEDELVFRSNPRFVFHDSCGFEAGSEEQFDRMKKFVMDRAKTAKLDKRIHAIWFCVPLTDSHRMVTASEKKFFVECDTGHVPVILLATKADALELEAIEQLEENEMTVDGAGIEEEQQVLLKSHLAKLREWLKDTEFPPRDYLSLSGMQQGGADCTPLIRCTTDALGEEGLQQLLVSTQQSNLGVCIEFAIIKTLKKHMNEKMAKIGPTSLAFTLSKWFPYKYQYQFFGGLGDQALNLYKIQDRDLGMDHLVQDLFQQDGLPLDSKDDQKGWASKKNQGLDLQQLVQDLHGEGQGSRQLGQEVDDDLVPAIQHTSQKLKMPILSTSTKYPMQFIAEHGTGVLLVLEYLYFTVQGKNERMDLQEGLTLAVKQYQSSGTQAKVNKLIKEAFQKCGENVDSLCPILVGIAKEHQMSKTLNRKG